MVARRDPGKRMLERGRAAGEIRLSVLCRMIKRENQSKAKRLSHRQPRVGDDLPAFLHHPHHAPTQMVTKKAMIRTGTARRSSGSAFLSRR